MKKGGLRTKGYCKQSIINKPLISVITAVLNGEQYLEKSIQSVISQTYDNVEYLIIDGNSTDRTTDIIKKYENKINYWISEPDSGIYHAWNKALGVSNGDWIIFIGADDCLNKNWLSRVSIIDKKKNDLVFGNLEVKLSDREVILKKIHIHDNGEIIRMLKYKMVLFHPGLAHNRRLFEKKNFSLDYQIVSDWHFLATSNLSRVTRINETQATSLLGGMSNSKDFVKLHYFEFLNVREELGNQLYWHERLFWYLKRILCKNKYIYNISQHIWRKKWGRG